VGLPVGEEHFRAGDLLSDEVDRPLQDSDGLVGGAVFEVQYRLGCWLAGLRVLVDEDDDHELFPLPHLGLGVVFEHDQYSLVREESAPGSAVARRKPSDIGECDFAFDVGHWASPFCCRTVRWHASQWPRVMDTGARRGSPQWVHWFCCLLGVGGCRGSAKSV